MCDPKDRGKIDRALNDHLHKEKKFEVEFRLRHSCGEERYCLARGKAQRDGSGRPFRMSGIVTDITERKRAEERSRFFAEAGTLLSATLDCQTTFNNLASLAVPRIADWCIIEQKKYHPCCIAIAHVEPSKEAIVWKLAEYIDDAYGEQWSKAQLDSNFEVTDSLLAQLAQFPGTSPTARTIKYSFLCFCPHAGSRSHTRLDVICVELFPTSLYHRRSQSS